MFRGNKKKKNITRIGGAGLYYAQKSQHSFDSLLSIPLQFRKLFYNKYLLGKKE